MELASAGEHNNRNLGIAENGELVGLLEKPVPSFRVCHLAVGGVLYPLDLDLPSSHELISLLMQLPCSSGYSRCFFLSFLSLSLSLRPGLE